MIKFFRKIRKKLLTEGKTSKYFKYAIGEIVLVVIGILIALQINNWNENRAKKQILKTHLTNLIDDLKLDQNKIEELEFIHDFRYYSMDYLLKMSGTNTYIIADDEMKILPFHTTTIWKKKIPKAYDKAFIQQALLWSHRLPRYANKTNAINELSSTGYYSNINQNLKVQINEYYDQWGFYFKDISDTLAEYWLASLGEDGFTNADTYHLDDPLILIKNNTKRIALLKRMIRESGWILVGIVKTKERNKQLILEIEKEIATL